MDCVSFVLYSLPSTKHRAWHMVLEITELLNNRVLTTALKDRHHFSPFTDEELRLTEAK